MYIRMKFIGVLPLLVIFSSLSALGLQLDHEPEDSEKLNSNNSKKSDQIITLIKSRSFQNALSKMQFLKGDIQGTMNYIIHEVYNNNVANFNLILQLLNNNDNITTNLATYEALNYEMNVNHHNDRLLRLTIMKSFNSKNFDQSAVEVTKLKDELHKVVDFIVVEELKNAVKSKNSENVKIISENVYEYYPELFKEVITQVLNERFDEIDGNYLVKFFMNHEHADQSMYAYSAVFEELKKRNSLDQSLAVTLASGIKEALDKSTNLETFREGYRLRDELPVSTKNIAFTSPVYIVNKNGEYLYAAGDVHNADYKRRKVYTWTLKERISQGMWFIERHGDVYQIKNYRNETHTEYLLRSLIPSADHYSFVYTWIPGGTDDYAPKQFNWVFEPSGDYVYIRNEYKKEYLYVSNEFEGIDREDRRIVYTDKSQEKVDGSLWKIVSLLNDEEN